jgi:type IV fimbrial biogenesis protein FimT
MTHHRHPHSRRQSGVTLIEAAITTTVLTIAVGLAMPSLQQARERRHLEGVAAQLETDIQYTRSLAVARNEGTRIGFVHGPQASCYVIHTGAAGACSCSADGAAVCSGGAQALRTVHLGAAVPVRVQSNAGSMLFDPVKATVTPTGTVRVLARDGTAIHHVVNVMGRVRSCSPAPALPGYQAC